MAIAKLANLLGADAAAYGGAYQNAQGQWVKDVTSNEGVTQQQSLQDTMTADQWQQFQNQLSGGYLTSSSGVGGKSVLNVNTAALPKVLGQFNVNSVLQNMGGGFAGLGADQQAGPNLSRGVNNQAGVKWDPNYGWITPMSNLKSDDDLFNKIGGTIGDIAPYAIAAAMTAGGAGAIGAAGGAADFAGIFSKIPGLVNTISNFGQSPQSNLANIVQPQQQQNNQGLTGDSAVLSLLSGTQQMQQLANLLGNG